MKLFSLEQTFSKDDIDEMIEKVLNGDVKDILLRIAFMFIPDVESISKRTNEPLSLIDLMAKSTFSKEGRKGGYHRLGRF